MAFLNVHSMLKCPGVTQVQRCTSVETRKKFSALERTSYENGIFGKVHAVSTYADNDICAMFGECIWLLRLDIHCQRKWLLSYEQSLPDIPYKLRDMSLEWLQMEPRPRCTGRAFLSYSPAAVRCRERSTVGNGRTLLPCFLCWMVFCEAGSILHLTCHHCAG